MIARRVCTRPTEPTTSTPRSSGPRCRRAPAMRSSAARSGACPGGMTQPAMPHMRRGTLSARGARPYTAPALRGSRAIRNAAWTVLAAGVIAPLVRRRLDLSAAAVGLASGAAPVALCVLRPRTRGRDVATCCLQMWAYVALYHMPHDDPGELERRVRVDYPVRLDRLLGLGVLPTLRLQRWLSRPGRITPFDRLLIWVHW